MFNEICINEEMQPKYTFFIVHYILFKKEEKELPFFLLFHSWIFELLVSD